MTNVFDEDATTIRTLGNVKKTLTKSLTDKYGKGGVANSLLKIHGLDKKNFDFVSNAEAIISGKLNDESIDDNSNKSDKASAGILNEVTSPVHKAVGYDYLYRMLVEQYGKKEAKRLSGELYDYSLAISDSTKLLVPYCYSIDATKLVTFGRPFGQLHSAPPKRVASYISALNETVHQLSSHLAGAIAVGSFFLDIAKLSIFAEKIAYDQLFEPSTRKYLENCMQNFVHSVNHLSRLGSESPFTNISVFDRAKISAFLNDMWFYFDPSLVADEDLIDDEITKEYVTEYILEIQNIFLDFFDKGDPLTDGMPFRFPVVTLNVSKSSTGEVLDPKFLDNVVNREIYRYNIFSSEGTKIASCCRLVSDSEMLELAGQSNSFGGAAAISLGSHRVVTINFNRIALEANKSSQAFLDILEERIEDTVKILKAHKQLIAKTVEAGLQPFISMGWINMKRLFSTVGILGLVEACETMGYEGDEKDSFMAHILTTLNASLEGLGKEYDLVINIEQIPAESMSHRLPKADKLLFGEDKVPYTLYANQFIPLWEDATLWERMEKDGKFNKLITGGGIVHFSLGEITTPSQNRKIIEASIKSGCEHFALNSVYSLCDKGHAHFGDHIICPKCDSVNITHYTRTVGFFTPVENWSTPKQVHDFQKRTFRGVE